MSAHKLLGATLLVGALSLGTAQVVSAHHSAAPHFNTDIDMEITGIVTEWSFVNPHSYIYLDVENADGSITNWRCEHTAAAALMRMNYTEETFVPGMKVTIFGAPARREDNVCLVLNMAFDDGVQIPRNSALPENRIRGEVFAEAALSTDHNPVNADGSPNISGYWVRIRGARPGGEDGAGGMGAPEGGMGAAMGGGMGGQQAAFPYTAAGQAAADKYEQIYDDPTIKCGISSIFFGMTHDQNVNHIQQLEDRITFLYGFMDYERTIWMDGRDFPETIEPTQGGYSIGKWDGNTLVVETKGFLPGVLQPLRGNVYSDQMESVERFTYNTESSRLERSYVAKDPLFFTEDYTGSDDLAKSDQAYTPYNCVELSGLNNLRPDSPEYAAEVNRMEAEGISIDDVKAGVTDAAADAKDMASDAVASTGLPKWLLALGALIILLGGFMALKGKKS